MPMRLGGPDTSLLARLLRSRLVAGRHPLTGKDDASPPDGENRSTSVIGSLLRDTRLAHAHHIQRLRDRGAGESGQNAGTPADGRRSDLPDHLAPANTSAQHAAAMCAPCAPAKTRTTARTPPSAAPAEDAIDLSETILEVLNGLDWSDWVTARCDFPATGPYVDTAQQAAFAPLSELLGAVFADAGNDGADLVVSIYAGRDANCLRFSAAGPFDLSLNTLTAIRTLRPKVEETGGELNTLRDAGNCGFEIVLPVPSADTATAG